MNERIAVLLGGTSSERVISLRSGEAVAEALTRLGYEVVRFDPQERDWRDLKEEGVAKAFVILHGRGGEDGTAQAILEWLQIPYTGSGVLASALAMDKWRTKLLWQALGLPVIPGYRVVRAEWERDPEGVVAAIARQVPPPWFVKPVHEGSSVGAGSAEDERGLVARVTAALAFDEEALVERCINGRELTVAFLGEEILPAIEIETPTGNYDFYHKYESNETRYHCPAQLSDAEWLKLMQLVRAARDALGCEGWGRVDLLWDRDGPKLLEMNTAPGMTDHSLVPMAARAVGISFEALCARILATARLKGAIPCRTG
jgi:D-alanine-D-alanine ligase